MMPDDLQKNEITDLLSSVHQSNLANSEKGPIPHFV